MELIIPGPIKLERKLLPEILPCNAPLSDSFKDIPITS